jgi:hypothetical protein
MLRTDEREIDGMKFACTQFSALKALTMVARLTKIALPLLGAAILRKKGPNPIALLAGMKDMAPDDLEALAVDLLASTQYKGDVIRTLDSREKINQTFSGKFGTMIKAMLFAIEVNYADFMSGLKESGAAEQPAPSSAEASA